MKMLKAIVYELPEDCYDCPFGLEKWVEGGCGKPADKDGKVIRVPDERCFCEVECNV